MYIFGLVCIVFCLTDCFHWREKNKEKGEYFYMHYIATFCADSDMGLQINFAARGRNIFPMKLQIYLE